MSTTKTSRTASTRANSKLTPPSGDKPVTIKTTPTTNSGTNSMHESSSGVKPATNSQSARDSQSSCAVGGSQTTPTTKEAPNPTAVSSSGSQLADSQIRHDTHCAVAVGANFTTSQNPADAHIVRAGGDQTTPKTTVPTDSMAVASSGDKPTNTDGERKLDRRRDWYNSLTTTRQVPSDTHPSAASGSNFPPDQNRNDAHRLIVGRDQTPSSHTGRDSHRPPAAGPILRDPVLGVLADVLDDLESVRIANENRLRTLTATDEYGHGLTIAHPEIMKLAGIVAALNAKAEVLKTVGYPPDLLPDNGGLEHQAQLNLCRVVRKHPLWEFAKPLKGVGEKQFARLLAVIGDPYWNDLHGRPRTLSEFRSYCGFGDATAQRRQRGQKSNWNTTARSRVWLIAESCMKQKESGQYRKVYDAARLHYADAIHTDECKRCGPAGKPAQPGTPLSLAHQHARGLRAIAKQLLKDLWLTAQQHHQENA